MASFTIEVTGLPSLLRKLNPALYQGAVTELLTSLSGIGEQTAREKAPRDTGALQQSIMATVQPMMATVSTPLAYARVMNDGRRPGARPPPSQALAGWASRHGFRGSLYLLARSIGRKGTPGKHFMEAAKAAIEAAAPAELARAASQIVANWRE